MEPLGYHLTFRLAVDRSLTASPEARRLLARTILTVARPFPMLAFRWADTHGHVLVVGDRRSAGELARRIEIALQKVMAPGVRFAPAHFTPVYDLKHLRRAFFYVLGQDEHHGLGNDPLHEASNLPDLLGARTIGLWTARHVREHLARIKRADLLAIAGWRDDVDGLLDPLADAAAAAVALPHLQSNTPDARRARRAAVEVGGSLPAATLAELLEMTPQAIGRLRRRPADAATVRAVRAQLAARAIPRAEPLLASNRSPAT